MSILPGVVEWEAGDEARFTRKPMSVDGTFQSVLAVDTERKVGVFTSPTGEAQNGSGGQRDLWILNDAPSDTTRARATFWGGPYVGNHPELGSILPQHGVALRYKEEGGRRKAIVVWQNITFSTTWSILVGVWASDISGSTNFVNRQIGQIMPSLGDSAAIVSCSRSNGVVTLTLGEQAPFVVDSYVRVDAQVASFDGQFLIDEVDGNRIRYRQDGLNESGGSGTANNVFPYDVDVWSPNNDSIVQVRAKRRNDPVWPEWVSFDTSAGFLFPGTNGSYWSAPAATVASPTQMSIRALVTMADWTPPADQTIIAKYVSAGNQRCFWLRVKAAGTLEILWSPAGGTTGSTASTVALPATNGQPLALRMDYDQATTSVTFYTSTSMYGPWVQLGDVRTGLAGMGIFNSISSPVEIGSALVGTANVLNGRVHALTMFTNLTQTAPIIDVCANALPDGQTPVTDRAGVEWTAAGTASLVNGGIATNATSFAVDINEAGTWDSRTAAGNSMPTASGQPGIIAAHLGTSPLSHAEHARTAFSSSSTLPIESDDPTNDQAHSMLYWADERDRAYGEPTRDYFLTLGDALEAAIRLSPGQFIEVRGPGT